MFAPTKTFEDPKKFSFKENISSIFELSTIKQESMIDNNHDDDKLINFETNKVE